MCFYDLQVFADEILWNIRETDYCDYVGFAQFYDEVLMKAGGYKEVIEVNYSDYELSCMIVDEYNKTRNAPNIKNHEWFIWACWMIELHQQVSEEQKNFFFPDLSTDFPNWNNQELASHYNNIAIKVKLDNEVKSLNKKMKVVKV